MPHLNPRVKSAGLPHRSRLNVARGAGRTAETNDSSLRWGPWTEFDLASGAVLGLAGAFRTENPVQRVKAGLGGLTGFTNGSPDS